VRGVPAAALLRCELIPTIGLSREAEWGKSRSRGTFEMLLLPRRRAAGTILPRRLATRRGFQSGKFPNAITSPPCVCLDKGIMRFYASHACSADLQRCLRTSQPPLSRETPAGRCSCFSTDFAVLHKSLGALDRIDVSLRYACTLRVA